MSGITLLQSNLEVENPQCRMVLALPIKMVILSFSGQFCQRAITGFTLKIMSVQLSSLFLHEETQNMSGIRLKGCVNRVQKIRVNV